MLQLLVVKGDSSPCRSCRRSRVLPRVPTLRPRGPTSKADLAAEGRLAHGLSMFKQLWGGGSGRGYISWLSDRPISQTSRLPAGNTLKQALTGAGEARAAGFLGQQQLFEPPAAQHPSPAPPSKAPRNRHFGISTPALAASLKRYKGPPL